MEINTSGCRSPSDCRRGPNKVGDVGISPSVCNHLEDSISVSGSSTRDTNRSCTNPHESCSKYSFTKKMGFLWVSESQTGTRFLFAGQAIAMASRGTKKLIKDTMLFLGIEMAGRSKNATPKFFPPVTLQFLYKEIWEGEGSKTQ